MYSKVYPNGPDSESLLDRTLETAIKSSEQLERTRNHSHPVLQARGLLENQKQAVDSLKGSLNTIGNKDNQINIKLREIQSDNRKCNYKNE